MSASKTHNTLYYGDNLAIMREHLPDESVDLIYLDPPFNSARDYNVLFKQAKRDENQAQIVAFEDTWHWSKARYQEFFDDPCNVPLFNLMESLHRILGTSDMMAYLVMMAPRIIELHRVLAPTGTLYLHCDPTAGHYLRIILDGVFGAMRFRNEIIWKRTSAKGLAFTRFASNHDVILRYIKSTEATWNAQYAEHDREYVKQFYGHVESKTGRRYSLDNLVNPNRDRPNLTYEFLGVTRVWRWTKDRMLAAHKKGLVIQAKPGSVPRLKRYLDEQEGTPVGDVWIDIPPIGAQSHERMGYPTQKPLALLERIINASSNEGDLVLDPFCGCGTAVVAAEKLGRRWIGIDVTFIAVDLMISRLASDFSLKRGKHYKTVGDPKDAYSALKLFEESPKEFEKWAVGLVAGVPQPEKVGDKGIDGKVYFQDLEENLQFAVVQVKGGHLNPGMIRDFAHVIDREKAAMGYFICLETPTKGMYSAAEEAGFFTSPSRRKISKMQIRTIKELLEENKEFDFPKGYSLKSGGRRLLRSGEMNGELFESE
ncbi:MAG: site-specific DNA-methyltransferase [candidate division Zixibacteria bacterium]|nr:site-specific DNA-methyltransferase [candidate division Zixibacteria bacterium]